MLLNFLLMEKYYIHNQLNWFMSKTSNECVLKNIKKTKNDIQVELIKNGCKYIHENRSLAKKEINLTGGEASQNPYIVDIFKIFKTLFLKLRLSYLYHLKG